MNIFLDTSAILAVLDADDLHHPKADALWQRLLASDEGFLSTNYVLVETFALVQRRLGMDAVRAFEREIVPLLDVHWLDAETHQAAITRFLTSSRRVRAWSTAPASKSCAAKVSNERSHSIPIFRSRDSI